MYEKLPSAMVLVYQPKLTHSVWQDVMHNKRTFRGLEKMLKDGVKKGEYVGFRFMTIHHEEMGVVE